MMMLAKLPKIPRHIKVYVLTCSTSSIKWLCNFSVSHMADRAVRVGREQLCGSSVMLPFRRRSRMLFSTNEIQYMGRIFTPTTAGENRLAICEMPSAGLKRVD